MSQPRVSPWRTPLQLAAVGLLLMVGGYHLMSYQGLTPHDQAQQRQLEELRRQAQEQGRTDPDKKELADRLSTLQQHGESPRFRLLGRLTIYAGLLLFVAAFLIMYRTRPRPGAAEEEEAEGEDFLSQQAYHRE